MCETLLYIFPYNCNAMQNICPDIWSIHQNTWNLNSYKRASFCYHTAYLLNRERFGNIVLQLEPSEHYSSLCLLTSSFCTKLSSVRFALQGFITSFLIFSLLWFFISVFCRFSSVIVAVFSASGINHFNSIAFILLCLNPFHTQSIFKMQTSNGLMGLVVKHASLVNDLICTPPKALLRGRVFGPILAPPSPTVIQDKPTATRKMWICLANQLSSRWHTRDITISDCCWR